MKTVDIEQNIAALAIDPLRFCCLCWPEMLLYDKQVEVLLSVRDNVETFVHAANELGKTRIAAVAVLWWFASRTPARVVTSSSGETQLKQILWTEIRNLIATAAYPLPFRVTTLQIEKLKDPRTQDRDHDAELVTALKLEHHRFAGDDVAYVELVVIVARPRR